jgi:hypothetical protein
MAKYHKNTLFAVFDEILHFGVKRCMQFIGNHIVDLHNACLEFFSSKLNTAMIKPLHKRKLGITYKITDKCPFYLF